MIVAFFLRFGFCAVMPDPAVSTLQVPFDRLVDAAPT